MAFDGLRCIIGCVFVVLLSCSMFLMMMGVLPLKNSNFIYASNLLLFTRENTRHTFYSWHEMFSISCHHYMFNELEFEEEAMTLFEGE